MQELTHLDHPIDVMYLIHRALRREAKRVERCIDSVEMQDHFQPFTQTCHHWLMCLGYHAAIEDTCMTALLSHLQPAQVNVATHAMLVQTGERLLDDLNALTDHSMNLQTQYRLYQKIVSLRMAQDDHLETEETTILPIIRQQISETQQLELTKRLLIDPHVVNDGWVIDWVAREVTDTERQLLIDLEKRFDNELPQSLLAWMPLIMYGSIR